MSLEFELDSLHDKITIKTKAGKQVTYDFQEELSFSAEELDKAFMEQPGKYAWWGVLAEQAKSQKDQLEAILERVEAEADYDCRLKMELNGEKITEAAVKRAIKKNEAYMKALEEFNEVKKMAAILDKMVKAFDHRLECIVNLGAKLRKENRSS